MFGRFKYRLSEDPLFGGGGGNPPGGTPPGGTSPGGDPPAPPTAGFKLPDNWKDAVSEDLRKQPFMTKYGTVDDLAKGYSNLEKMIGSDKVVVPQRGTKLSDMRDYFEKVGLPGKIEDYKIEGIDPKKIDPGFMADLSKTAHGLNILPEQTKGLVEWFIGADEAARKALADSQVAASQSALLEFKKELGDAYGPTIVSAQKGLALLGEADQKFIKEQGLGTNVTVLRMLAKMGETVSEGTIRGAGVNTPGALTPAEASERISEIMRTPNHPYFDSGHAGHQTAKKEMQLLFSQAHPGPAKVTKEF